MPAQHARLPYSDRSICALFIPQGWKTVVLADHTLSYLVFLRLCCKSVKLERGELRQSAFLLALIKSISTLLDLVVTKFNGSVDTRYERWNPYQ